MSTSTTSVAADHKEFLDTLPAILEKARINGGIKGMSVAILYKGEFVFAQGFGKRNSNDPFTKETVSHIASVSKAFTATAIGELVAEGKVDWNKTPVSHYLPEFELKDSVLTKQLTFADMLSHRTPVPPIDTAWFRNEESPLELIKQLRHLDLPTTKMSPVENYNNIIYAVAGEAAARVAGVSYAELITSKIFQPLGLQDAGLSLPEMAKQPNYAMPYDAASYEDAKDGIFVEGYIDEIPMADAPAGDIFMNVMELCKWGRIILKEGELDGKQVLNKESIQETLRPHSISEQDGKRNPDMSPITGYGFGWVLDSYKGHTYYCHGGSNPGYVTNIAVFPDADLVVSHIVNVDIAELPSILFYYIADELLGLKKTTDWLSDEILVQRTRETYSIIAKEIEGSDDIPEQIEGTSHAHELANYAGVFKHPVYGTIVLRIDDDGNSLRFKMRTLEGEMTHYHFESFVAPFADFAAKGKFFLTFVTAPDGKIESLKTVMDDLDLEFKRQEA
ncbi:hypothetical protein FBU30_007006 [Linnemannia zychae]|nr:hypothetical protein FBU30_007006 [Linnemannia zychae]